MGALFFAVIESISMKILATVSTKTALFFILTALFWHGQLTAQSEPGDLVFARINDRTILNDEFTQIFRSAVRHKYYHGEVPAAELASFQRRVGSDIVEQILIHEQATKLGLKPDLEKILAGLAEYDNKYKDSAEWQVQKEKALQHLLNQLERQDLIKQLRAQVEDIERPDLSAVKAYYLANPEKFTEPRRVWVSVILISVQPSATNEVWLAAKDAADGLIQRINQGESFSDIARAYSSHLSAVNGGDLGYLHQGMLEGEPEIIVNNLKIDEVSSPIHVLEGITIFRLNGIQPAKLKPFDEVSERAGGLLYGELQEKAWNQYLSNLKSTADIYINENLYAPADEN